MAEQQRRLRRYQKSVSRKKKGSCNRGSTISLVKWEQLEQAGRAGLSA